MSNGTFTTPVEDRYFEDYVAGAVHEFDGIVVEEAEVIAFRAALRPAALSYRSGSREGVRVWRVDCQRLAYSEPYDAALC